MTYDHMALVRNAVIGNPIEKAVLMAMAGYADPDGYCYPSVTRLVEDTEYSQTAVIQARKRLEKKNLIAHRRRTGSSGRSTSNLYRLNTAAIRAAQRPAKDYGDNLIEIVFGDPEEPETPALTSRHVSDAPPPTSDAPRGYATRTLGGASDAPHELPKEPTKEDRSLSRTEGHQRADARDGVREIADPSTEDTPQASQEPRRAPSAPTRPPGAAAAVLTAYEAATGRPAVNGTVTRMLDDAHAFLDAGYPVEWLCDRAAEMAAHGWTDLAKHVERSTVPFPGQRSAEPKPTRPALPECRECERPVVGDPVDGLCRDCRTDREKPAELCFFCENTERPGWRYDADGDLVECDHLDEYAAN